jgi:hypothetical protein
LSVLLYLSDDFEGGETNLHLPDQKRSGDGSAAAEESSEVRGGAAAVSVVPVTGSALCFGQSFKFGR